MRPFTRLDRLSDDALLAAFSLGEPDAAIVFVRRFQRRVYGLALLIAGDPNQAEDIAQQSFERAWRHGATYDRRRGSVTTWLLSITRHVAIDQSRLRRAEPVDPWSMHELLGPSGALDPQHEAESGDQFARLRSELGALPVEQRRAVLLATMGGRTTIEIAQIEAIPLGTAKTRLRAGLRKLRDATMDVNR
jgi:RNA polymerase sigma-70 factor (ECF subfamily)